jgi:hypothetical protein
VPCLFGARVVQDIFRRWNTPLLHGHLIWTPMLPADNLDAAMAQESLFQDNRVAHYWDGGRALGMLASQILDLADPIAWDVYLLYPAAVTWHGESMPAPGFLMHQQDERPDLYLDPDRLAAEVRKAIEAAAKGEMTDD